MALEVTNWDALRLMRSQGHKPSLPVIVTSKTHLPRRLDGVGCLAILHQAGESPPVQLLDGLDVIVWFDTCELGARFMRFALNRGVKFARYQAWCTCGKNLTVLALDCKSYADGDAWFERQRSHHAA